MIPKIERRICDGCNQHYIQPAKTQFVRRCNRCKKCEDIINESAKDLGYTSIVSYAICDFIKKIGLI